MLPIITFGDVGSPTAPGEYGYGEARIQVDVQHLSVWASDPGAAFHTILLTRAGDNVQRLALGARER